MIYYLKFWKELVLIILVFIIGVLVLKLQDSQYKLQMTKIAHSSAIKDAELKNAELLLEYNIKRKEDLQKYVSKVENINDRYANLVSTNNRMQQKVTTYNTNLHTVARETLEAYAKTGTLLFNECRKEYIDLGQYTSKVDAELDKVTRTP